VRLAAGNRRHRLPEFFGNEGQQRVCQAQDGFQHARQGPPRGADFLFAALLQLDLGQLDVPVAELVPDELVHRARQQVEAVVGEVLRDLGFGALQLADDPAVGEGEAQR
jgi:hypothetical protein